MRFAFWGRSWLDEDDEKNKKQQQQQEKRFSCHFENSNPKFMSCKDVRRINLRHSASNNGFRLQPTTPEDSKIKTIYCTFYVHNLTVKTLYFIQKCITFWFYTESTMLICSKSVMLSKAFSIKSKVRTANLITIDSIKGNQIG